MLRRQVRVVLQGEVGHGETQVLGLTHVWGAFYLLLLGNGVALLLLAWELLIHRWGLSIESNRCYH